MSFVYQLGRARRFMWQRDRFVLLRRISATPAPIVTSSDTMPIRWVGINAAARVGESHADIPLSAYGKYLRDHGDAGVIALDAQGEIAGWLWAREGPSVETAGPGFLKIPHDVRVIRDFKVHPNLRGRGLGHRLFAELGSRIPYDSAARTIAIVAPDNAPSLACVTWAGFEAFAAVDVRRIAGIRLTRVIPPI
jgi:ribosomal protein S18 acetylase RimI-like enzyme